MTLIANNFTTTNSHFIPVTQGIEIGRTNLRPFGRIDAIERVAKDAMQSANKSAPSVDESLIEKASASAPSSASSAVSELVGNIAPNWVQAQIAPIPSGSVTQTIETDYREFQRETAWNEAFTNADHTPKDPQITPHIHETIVALIKRTFPKAETFTIGLKGSKTSEFQPATAIGGRGFSTSILLETSHQTQMALAGKELAPCDQKEAFRYLLLKNIREGSVSDNVKENITHLLKRAFTHFFERASSKQKEAFLNQAPQKLIQAIYKSLTDSQKSDIAKEIWKKQHPKTKQNPHPPQPKNKDLAKIVSEIESQQRPLTLNDFPPDLLEQVLCKDLNSEIRDSFIEFLAPNSSCTSDLKSYFFQCIANTPLDNNPLTIPNPKILDQKDRDFLKRFAFLSAVCDVSKALGRNKHWFANFSAHIPSLIGEQIISNASTIKSLLLPVIVGILGGLLAGAGFGALFGLTALSFGLVPLIVVAGMLIIAIGVKVLQTHRATTVASDELKAAINTSFDLVGKKELLSSTNPSRERIDDLSDKDVRAFFEDVYLKGFQDHKPGMWAATKRLLSNPKKRLAKETEELLRDSIQTLHRDWDSQQTAAKELGKKATELLKIKHSSMVRTAPPLKKKDRAKIEKQIKTVQKELQKIEEIYRTAKHVSTAKEETDFKKKTELAFKGKLIPTRQLKHDLGEASSALDRSLTKLRTLSLQLMNATKDSSAPDFTETDLTNLTPTQGLDEFLEEHTASQISLRTLAKEFHQQLEQRQQTPAPATAQPASVSP